MPASADGHAGARQSGQEEQHQQQDDARRVQGRVPVMDDACGSDECMPTTASASALPPSLRVSLPSERTLARPSPPLAQAPAGRPLAVHAVSFEDLDADAVIVPVNASRPKQPLRNRRAVAVACVVVALLMGVGVVLGILLADPTTHDPPPPGWVDPAWCAPREKREWQCRAGRLAPFSFDQHEDGARSAWVWQQCNVTRSDLSGAGGGASRQRYDLTCALDCSRVRSGAVGEQFGKGTSLPSTFRCWDGLEGQVPTTAVTFEVEGADSLVGIVARPETAALWRDFDWLPRVADSQWADEPDAGPLICQAISEEHTVCEFPPPPSGIFCRNTNLCD